MARRERTALKVFLVAGELTVDVATKCVPARKWGYCLMLVGAIELYSEVGWERASNVSEVESDNFNYFYLRLFALAYADLITRFVSNTYGVIASSSTTKTNRGL